MRLAMVVLACVIPATLGFALMLGHFYDRELAQIKRDTLLTARALVLAVDRDLNSGKISALALATSPNLATNDLAAFHAQAKSLLGEQFPGFTFVLSDASGQQIVNTLRPYGDPLPRHGNPEQLRKVFETGRPVVSDVYIGGVLRQPLVGIDVPVWRGGQVVYDLSVAFLPERLGAVLREQRLPQERIVAIFDSKGAIVARTHDAKRLVGKLGAPALLERLKSSDEGDLETMSVEGIPVYSMYSRSLSSGWSVAIGIPREVVVAELRRSIALLTLAVLALLLAGFAAAWVLGGRISQSVKRLTMSAKALGSGQPLDGTPGFFLEADEMASTLNEVEAELMQHRHHLEDLVAETTKSLQVAQQDVLQREKFTNAVFEGTPESLLLVDTSGHVVRNNRAAVRTFGYAPDGLVGLPVDSLVPASADLVQAALSRKIAPGTPQSMPGTAPDFMGRHLDGSEFPVELALSPIRFENQRFVIVSLVDISLRREAEDTLAHYRAIVESTDDAIISKTLEGIVTSWNKGAEQIFGYRRDEMIGKPIGLLIPEQYMAEEHMMLGKVATGEWVKGREVVRQRKDGTLVDISATISPLYDAKGNIVGASKVARDITERKRTERALAKAGGELQTIIDHMPSLVVYWDAGLLNRFANKGYMDWFGLTPEQMRGKHISEVFGETRYRQIESMLQSVLKGNSVVFERSVALFDGSRRQALFSYVPDIVDGKVTGMYGIITDISVLNQAQKDKSQALGQLQSVIDAATEFSIIATAPNGVITLFSRGAEKMLGYTAADLVNDKTLAVVHSLEEVAARGLVLSREYELPIANLDVLLEPARRGQSAEREWTYVRKDGSRLPVSLSVTAMRNPAGHINGFLGVAKDISQDRAARQALADARDQANAANVAKSQFLANMSHEIRTPMNAILGMQQLLQRTELNAQQDDYVGKTRNAAKSLLDILNDILDFSKVEAGKMELERHPFGFTPLLNDMCTILDGNLGGRPVALRIARDANLPEWVFGDDLRLRQVLLNLAGNSIKFTQQGEIVVALHVVSQGLASSIVEFSVKDSGIGIAPEHLQHIFEGFSQAESSTTRRFGGTGLGLAICKRLVGLMGGDLQVHSKPGEGSRFFFTIAFEHAQNPVTPGKELPPPQAHVVEAHSTSSVKDRRQPARERSGQAPRGTRLAGMRLLVVEDNPINQQVARELLRAEGAVVEVAGGGVPGVERVLAADPPFDAVLMDIQMPDMDGYTATRKIRAVQNRPALQALPIIAMTANAMASDRLACLEAGMNEHIGKPFDIHVLVQTLQRLCTPAAP